MTELPAHLQPDQPGAGDTWRRPLQPEGTHASKPDRPFYKKKRYILPALLLTLGYCGQGEDSDDTVTADRPRAAASPSPTVDRQAFLAEQERISDDNARALAKTEADRKAKEQAAAVEAARVEAARVEAARLEAQRVEALRAEAERVAAQQAAANEAARLEAERQAAEQQQAPTNVYYANCDAVRAAGAAPIRAGQPGYADHLDRDGDGQGCGAD